MKIELKSRATSYCNLKLFLMFLVIYGHLIEPCVSENRILYEIYRIIYMVHMPLLVFLSGRFLKSRKSCMKQTRKALGWYGATQVMGMLFVHFEEGGKAGFLTPYWHLWYLLSLAGWSLIGVCYYFLAKHWQWLKSLYVKIGLILVAIIAGCLAGKETEINRRGSLSRTIVFLPYFLAGMFWKEEWDEKKNSRIGKICLIIGVSLYIMIRKELSVIFLYQAESYGNLNSTKGCYLRFMCYLIGGLWSFFFLTYKWDKKFSFTKAGTDTMMIYVLHAPIVRLVWEFSEWIPWYEVVVPFIAIWIIWGLYKIFQWSGEMYMITGRKGIQRNGCF